MNFKRELKIIFVCVLCMVIPMFISDLIDKQLNYLKKVY